MSSGTEIEIKLPVELQASTGDAGITGVEVKGYRGLYLTYALAGVVSKLTVGTIKVAAVWFAPRFGPRVKMADKIVE